MYLTNLPLDLEFFSQPTAIPKFKSPVYPTIYP